MGISLLRCTIPQNLRAVRSAVHAPQWESVCSQVYNPTPEGRPTATLRPTKPNRLLLGLADRTASDKTSRRRVTTSDLPSTLLDKTLYLAMLISDLARLIPHMAMSISNLAMSISDLTRSVSSLARSVSHLARSISGWAGKGAVPQNLRAGRSAVHAPQWGSVCSQVHNPTPEGRPTATLCPTKNNRLLLGLAISNLLDGTLLQSSEFPCYLCCVWNMDQKGVQNIKKMLFSYLAEHQRSKAFGCIKVWKKTKNYCRKIWK